MKTREFTVKQTIIDLKYSGSVQFYAQGHNYSVYETRKMNTGYTGKYRLFIDNEPFNPEISVTLTTIKKWLGFILRGKEIIAPLIY